MLRGTGREAQEAKIKAQEALPGLTNIRQQQLNEGAQPAPGGTGVPLPAPTRTPSGGVTITLEPIGRVQ